MFGGIHANLKVSVNALEPDILRERYLELPKTRQCPEAVPHTFWAPLGMIKIRPAGRPQGVHGPVAMRRWPFELLAEVSADLSQTTILWKLSACPMARRV